VSVLECGVSSAAESGVASIVMTLKAGGHMAGISRSRNVVTGCMMVTGCRRPLTNRVFKSHLESYILVMTLFNPKLI
jgi:hypothetical protein